MSFGVALLDCLAFIKLLSADNGDRYLDFSPYYIPKQDNCQAFLGFLSGQLRDLCFSEQELAISLES